MQVNFKIIIEYDGTAFYGWQRQKDKPTIQGTLESILSLILNQEIKIHGSGRTDAGVHAIAQVAHFKADTKISPQDLKKGVNSLIKHPIVVHDCILMPWDFHAQYHVKSKEYRYYILNRQTPCAVGRDYLWHINRPLNMSVMNECCQYLIGIHDFKAFENTGSPRSSTKREIFFAHWVEKENDRLVFCICASGFLKNMVRNLVGTLVDAGMGKIDPDEFKQMLKSCKRPLAGATAPARGLFLHQVTY